MCIKCTIYSNTLNTVSIGGVYVIQLDYKDRKPIYEQICEKFKGLITSGVLKPDEKVPSVRELAQTLTINPNTIQKAYRELETDGYIYTIVGKGSFVATLSSNFNQARFDQLSVEMEKLVQEYVYINVPLEKLLESVQHIYNKRRQIHND